MLSYDESNQRLANGKERMLLVLAVLSLAFALIILGSAAGGQKQQRRNLKTREFRDMPVIVREVRNLDSDTWYDELKIEIKNVSSKPIYFVLAYLQFPDVPVPENGVYGIALEFGERKNLDYRRNASPEDQHLNPGDKFVFTIPDGLKDGLKSRHQRSPDLLNKMELHFSVISFGDGTGYVAERLR
jgi:hypothetical protein